MSGRHSIRHSLNGEPCAISNRGHRHDGGVGSCERHPTTRARGAVPIADRRTASPGLVRHGDQMRYGVLKAGWGELRRRGLERDLTRFIIVQPDDELIKVCATLRADCEKAGHPLGQKIHEADRWIAATARGLGVELISDDVVFRNTRQLRSASFVRSMSVG